MKKINNICFIIALILCILMLFAYCNRTVATDLSSDFLTTDSGSLVPDLDENNKGTAFNTSVVYPPDFSNNNQYDNANNTLIFSGVKNFDSFLSDINSDKMYYSREMLQNNGVVQKSIYHFLIPKSPWIETTEVTVSISNLFETKETTALLYVPRLNHNYAGNGDFLFYQFLDYGEYNQILNFNMTNYRVCYLIVDIPYFQLPDDFENGLYNNSFYISSVDLSNVYNLTNISLTSNSLFYFGHLYDIFTTTNTYLSPINNTVYLSCINNFGAYLFDKNIDYVNDSRVFSKVLFGNNELLCYSNYNDYKFDYAEGEFLYTSFQCNSANFYLDYFAFGNGDFFEKYQTYFGADFDIYMSHIANGDYEYLANYSGFPYNNIFMQIETVVDNVTYGQGFSPFYSYPFIYTLNEAANQDKFGNLPFNDVNAQKYYIEPQDWKDFGAYFNNIVVWLCFEMPLLSNISKPIYLFLNGFLEIWVQVALPLATSLGLVGGALIFYLIYLFISKLLFNKAPD